MRSVLYFLHFASYTKYPNLLDPAVFGSYDLQGTVLFLRTHWRAYGLWIAVSVLPWFLFRAETRQAGGRWRFVIRTYLALCIAICLAVVWGRSQDGAMFYFISYFYFAIYYALTLPLVIAMSSSDRSMAWRIHDKKTASAVYRTRKSFRSVVAECPGGGGLLG